MDVCVLMGEQILSSVRHRHVIGLLEMLETDAKLYLVMEYASGDLLSHLQSRRGGRLPVRPHTPSFRTCFLVTAHASFLPHTLPSYLTLPSALTGSHALSQLEEALPLYRQLLSAVVYCHLHGVCHRYLRRWMPSCLPSFWRLFRTFSAVCCQFALY